MQNEDEIRSSDHMEAEENSLMINQRIKLKETAYFVLGKAWPHNINTQSKRFDLKHRHPPSSKA